jgi:menaquinone-9 beta-reductase
VRGTASVEWVHPDVVIVGAGPAGVAAAITLARHDRSVTVIDKAVFPRDKCCGDGLTTGCLRRLQTLGLDPQLVPSWQDVSDVRVGAPSGKVAHFPLPQGQGRFAAVARRSDLDHALVQLARRNGVTVLEGHALTGATQDADQVRLTVEATHDDSTRSFEFAAPFAIGADGMWSTLRKHVSGPVVGGPTNPYLGEWHAYRQYFNGVNTPQSKDLWVWFEQDLLPGYAWCFPLADG